MLCCEILLASAALLIHRRKLLGRQAVIFARARVTLTIQSSTQPLSSSKLPKVQVKLEAASRSSFMLSKAANPRIFVTYQGHFDCGEPLAR
jgi:hypothetical protein